VESPLCYWSFPPDEFKDYDTDGDGKISKAEFARKATPPSIASSKTDDRVATEQPKEKKELGLIGWLERDFQLRQSFFTPKESVNPAKFSWSKAKGESSFYHLDAAVLWRPAFLSDGEELGNGVLSWFIQPSFEAHISNQKGAAQDQLTFRVPFTLNYVPGGASVIKGMDTPGAVPDKGHFITVHTFLVSPTYQTDRHNDTRSLTAEIFYTPTIPDLAIGVRQPLFGTESVQLLWRPYIGLELGDYLERDATTSMAVERQVSRFVGRAEADLQFGRRFALVGSYVSRTELNGECRSFHYGEISAVLVLDTTLPEDESKQPHFTTGVTYKRGKDAPKFKQADVLTAWVGVRF
jgi:hypothetical protein